MRRGYAALLAAGMMSCGAYAASAGIGAGTIAGSTSGHTGIEASTPRSNSGEGPGREGSSGTAGSGGIASDPSRVMTRPGTGGAAANGAARSGGTAGDTASGATGSMTGRAPMHQESGARAGRPHGPVSGKTSRNPETTESTTGPSSTGVR